MKKITILLALALAIGVMFVGCGNTEAPAVETVNWISPMISFQTQYNSASVWNSDYALHRNPTFEYVLMLDGEEVAITADALIAGGAIPATLQLAYNGTGSYLTRIVAYAYTFFDHGRPTRIAAHAGGADDPNPQHILVLWQNPANGHWFNLIQDGIGRTEATLGAHHGDLTSLVRDTPQYTFYLNSETVGDISELNLFIVATQQPTRDDDFERSGYSLTFAVEVPDIDHHFHTWEILAASGTAVIVD